MLPNACEISVMAEKMLRQVKEVAPILLKYCGPGRVKGICPEGKMSRGKSQEIRARY